MTNHKVFPYIPSVQVLALWLLYFFPKLRMGLPHLGIKYTGKCLKRDVSWFSFWDFCASIYLGSRIWSLRELTLVCSHRHWDLAESMHGHLCTAATEAQSSLLLHPSSSGAKMDQPLVDSSQRKGDFSGKHTQSFQEAPVWVLQRTILFSLFFPDHPFLAPDLSMHSYMVRSMLVFGIQCLALENCTQSWKVWSYSGYGLLDLASAW